VLDSVQLRVKVRLGKRTMPIRDALGLAPGDVVDLGQSSEEPVEVLVGDIPIARGDILVVDDRFCVRVTEVLTPQPGAGEQCR
jgi:flagellar motor switch protein FliN/FliY